MTTLAELTTPLTVAEAQAGLYAAIAARGLSTTNWKPGAVVRTILFALAVMISALSQLQALIASNGFLLLAKGVWLTLVAKYVYGVDRDTGSFATGNVTLNNSGGGLYTGNPGDLVVINSSTGKTYRNTAAFTINPLETGVVVPVQAIELGSDSTADATAIDAFETPLLGVTVTNPTALVGTDPEEDDVLVLRCLEKTGTLSPNGPRDAYAFFARSAVRQDGTAIGVTRVKTVADGNGNVTVYVATATGGITGDVDDPATDLGAINKAIQENVVPLAVTATIVSATPLSILPTYEVWVSDAANLTSGQIQTAIAAALLAFVSSRQIGGDVISPATGKVYKSMIESTVGSAVPKVIKVSITVPAADVDVAVNEVPVLGAITVTGIHIVAGEIV